MTLEYGRKRILDGNCRIKRNYIVFFFINSRVRVSRKANDPAHDGITIRKVVPLDPVVSVKNPFSSVSQRHRCGGLDTRPPAVADSTHSHPRVEKKIAARKWRRFVSNPSLQTMKEWSQEKTLPWRKASPRQAAEEPQAEQPRRPEIVFAPARFV
jgi:hypothetical protein